MNTPRFKIGQQYQAHGKRKDICTIVDILTTTNSKGAVIAIRYLTVHDFMGQKVFNHDVVDATIATGICRLHGVNSLREALACGK
jgi:chorismate synthase